MSDSRLTDPRPAAEHDLTLVAAFMREVYRDAGMDPAAAVEYYRWKYFDLVGRDTRRPTAFLVQDDAGVVAFLGCLPFGLRRGGVVADAAWIADWHLLPRARGLGLGRALVDVAMRHIPVLASVNVTPDAARVLESRGFHARVGGAGWLRVERPFAYEWPARRGVRKALGIGRAVAHVASRARARRRRPRTAPPLTLVPCERCVRDVAIATSDGPVRDTAYLTWLARSPAARITWFALKRAGTVVGRGMLQRDVDTLGRRRVRLLDLSLRDPSLARDAYEAVAGELGRAGTDYAEHVADASLASVLEGVGFRRRAPRRVWANGAEPNEGWSLTFADKDDAFRGSPGVP